MSPDAENSHRLDTVRSMRACADRLRKIAITEPELSDDLLRIAGEIDGGAACWKK